MSKKESRRKANAKYHAKNKDKIRIRNAKHYAEHKEKYAQYRAEHREYKAQYRACKEYNITSEEYKILLNIKTCMICGHIENDRKLHIDHDHETGEVRGKLCRECNHGIGNFRDNTELLQKAITYLKKKSHQEIA